MTSQTIQIASQTQETIKRLIASGNYADANAVIEAALRMLEERDRKLAWLRRELAIGEDQEKRGETVPYTPDFMERLMREAGERSRQGMPVSDAVKP
jgi:putative addiction module CopG family antidote